MPDRFDATAPFTHTFPRMKQIAMQTIRRSAWGHVPVVLLAVLFLAPVLVAPDSGAWRGMWAFAVQAVAFGLLALLAARVSWSWAGLRRFVATGPNLALALLVGWAALSFALTAPNGGFGHSLALVELMRLACGAALYFAAVYFCCSRRQLRVASYLLPIGGIVAAVAGLLSFSPSGNKAYATAAFGDKQLLGAFLVGLLPAAAAFALPGQPRGRRCVAGVALVLVLCALLLSGNRSSWLGSMAGLLVVAALAFRTNKRRALAGHPRRWLAPTLAALAVLGLLFALSGGGSVVVARAKTLAALPADESFQLRLQVWSVSGRMLGDRPLTGWGVGSYPLKVGEYYLRWGGSQEKYTVPLAARVEQHGASLSSMAHSEYLQLAAELGLVGLALFLAVLGRFFYYGVRVLGRLGRGTRKWLLLAALGAVAAQSVDAIANPGWRYGEVSSLLWLLLGLGMAATRTPIIGRALPSVPPSPLPVTGEGRSNRRSPAPHNRGRGREKGGPKPKDPAVIPEVRGRPTSRGV